MKIYTCRIVLACIGFTVLCACKKEKNTEGGTRLYEVVSETNKKLVDYAYTSDGKLSRVTSYDTTGKVRLTTNYVYAGNTVTETTGGVGFYDSSVSFLDTRGYAHSVVYNYYNYQDTAVLEYDSEGYLSRALLTPQKRDTVLFTNKEGKRLSAKRPGTLGGEEVFEYYDFKDKNQIMPLLNHLSDYGDKYSKQLSWGKAVPYALKSRYRYSNNDPAHTLVYDYQYDLDKSSNISSIAVTISYKDSYELFKGRIYLHYR
ncbi:MAG TPA: hypothetical protein VL092_02975 [Chitinophagaceae bacterium]|nr:hypothetical protein [Chitinophagaceae bacterium]